MENLELVKCAECGATEETLYEVNGEMYCAECLLKLGYVQCTDCDEWFNPEESGIYVDDYGYVCSDCEDNYGFCERCETYHPMDDLHEVEGRCGTYYICDHCVNASWRYVICEDCGRVIDTEWHSYYNVNGEHTVCEDCISDYYYCEQCGEYFTDDEIMYDEAEDEYYCRECYDRIHAEQDNHHLKNYGYKPTPKPRTHEAPANDCTDVKDLLFGVELEVDKGPAYAVGDTIYKIADVSNDVYMKHDGSLDSGFEIVSHPCTLAYHMNDFAWRQITEIAKSAGFKSHDARTCGLHVHVGRYQLGEDDTSRRDTVAKIVMLVDRHWEALVKFSRRNSGQLNHWASRPQMRPIRHTDTPERAIDRALAADNGDRYQAVNLCNRGTIEFRLFNGSLKRDTVIATLQMVSNICQYAMTHTVEECLASKWEDLSTYRTWDELQAYLASNSLTTVTNPEAFTLNGEGTFKIGDRVRYKDYGGPKDYTGTIVIVRDDYYHDDSYSYGVNFDGFDGGHSLDGSIETIVNSGWWCTENDLVLAA